MATSFPCGSLEEFVLSSNRRQLLQVENDTKQNEEAELQRSSITYGSDQHLYFHLLQIENEITNILTNNNDLNNLSQSDTFKIKSLLQEANNAISTTNSSQNINVMNFRHKLRKLFLSPYIAMEQEEQENNKDRDIFDLLIYQLGVTFNHTKPTDIITKNINDNNEEQPISSIMAEFNVNKEFNELFSKCQDSNAILRFVVVCVLISISPHTSMTPYTISEISRNHVYHYY